MLGALCVIALILLLAYLKRKYFTLHEPIPGSPPTLLLGNTIAIMELFRGSSLTQLLRLLKDRFGDTFQLWIGPFRYVIVGNIKDVQHIFSNRNIYDQGDTFVERASVIFPNGLICLRGTYSSKNVNFSSFASDIQVRHSKDMQLSLFPCFVGQEL